MFIKPTSPIDKQSVPEDFPPGKKSSSKIGHLSRKDGQIRIWLEKVNSVYRKHGFDPQNKDKYVENSSIGLKGKKLNIFAEYQCLAAMIEAIQSLHLELPFEICINDAEGVKTLMPSASKLGEDQQDILKVCKRPPQLRTKTPSNLVGLYHLLTKAYPSLSTKIHFFPGMVKSAHCYSGLFFEFRLQLREEWTCVGKGGREKTGLEERVTGSFDWDRIYAVSHAQTLAETNRKNKPEYFIVFDREILAETALSLFMEINKKTEVSVLSSSIEEQIQYAREKGHSAVIVIKGRNDFVLIDLVGSAKEIQFKKREDLLAHLL